MKKVLIIEDNENNLYLMRKILQKLEYDIIEARDGATGVDLAIIKIRKNEITKDIIIIAVSSYAMEDDKEKAFAASCNDYIEKPIDPPSFIEILKKYSM